MEQRNIRNSVQTQMIDLTDLNYTYVPIVYILIENRNGIKKLGHSCEFASLYTKVKTQNTFGYITWITCRNKCW